MTITRAQRKAIREHAPYTSERDEVHPASRTTDPALPIAVSAALNAIASEPESVAVARERVLAAAAREMGAGDLESLAYSYRRAIRLHKFALRAAKKTRKT